MRSPKQVVLAVLLLGVATALPAICDQPTHTNEGIAHLQATPDSVSPGATTTVSFDYTIYHAGHGGVECPWEVRLDGTAGKRDGELLVGGSNPHDGNSTQTYPVSTPVVIPNLATIATHRLKVITGVDGWSYLAFAEMNIQVVGPWLSWVGTGGWETDGVSPNAGPPNSRFQFKVRYTDPTGAPPTQALLWIQKRKCNAWKEYRDVTMTKTWGSIATGAIYRYSCRIPNTTVRYRFVFTDSIGNIVGGAPTVYQDAPDIVGPPKLCPPKNGAVVAPRRGPVGTAFEYRVMYKDAAGNGPIERRLEIRRNGVLWLTRFLVPKTPPAGNLRYGQMYARTVTIDKSGTYEYRFTFRDGSGYATGTGTTWTPGPTITATEGLTLAGVAALPTASGAQVTFTLSAAANVTVTVVNVAGRPVRTLIVDKSLDAGLQTLLWNRKAESGLAVPAGLYLIRVTAHSPEGVQANALASLALR